MTNRFEISGQGQGMPRDTVYSSDQLADALGLQSDEAAILFEETAQGFRNRVVLSGVIDDLTAIFGSERISTWVRASNAGFDGSSALSLILSGYDGIQHVQKYVKAHAATPW